MIWGVGTGRCGTRSLAKQLGGVHEPQPWLAGRSMRHWQEKLDAESTEELKDCLRQRRDLDVPAVVCLQHSFCMDLIEEIDPDAKFVWVIRSPLNCIRSFLRGGTYHRKRHDGRSAMFPYLAEPTEGWHEAEGPLIKVAYHWLIVNDIILTHLVHSKRPWCKIYTHQLHEHENIYPPDVDHFVMQPYQIELVQELTENAFRAYEAQRSPHNWEPEGL